MSKESRETTSQDDFEVPSNQEDESTTLLYDDRTGTERSAAESVPEFSTEDKLACVTLDLENDWYLGDPKYDHLTFEYIDDYIELIQELDIPVTFFAVGKTIERFPDVIDKLDDQLDSEFHLHSYQHDTSKSYDFRTEIQNGKEAFKSHFGYDPKGYRAPQGNIESHEFEILEDEGFVFDSSVFPSYRPGVYSNLDKPLAPYQPDETDEMVEIPIAATPGTRIPICQSYLKLLGRPYLTYLTHAPLSDPLVFNTHLQDFYHTESHDQLDQPKQSIMKRNLDNSVELFSQAIEQIQDRGYSFGTMADIVQVYTESKTELMSSDWRSQQAIEERELESQSIEALEE